MATTTTKFNGNIDLSALRKKRFTIDNDPNRVLELNTSDLSTLKRLSDTQDKLKELAADASTIGNDENNTTEQLGEILHTIDTKMRECIDYIFDSNVSEVCAPSGSMYDPLGGRLRYEHIVSILTDLYETEIAEEMAKVNKRMHSHTDKYTK